MGTIKSKGHTHKWDHKHIHNISEMLLMINRLKCYYSNVLLTWNRNELNRTVNKPMVLSVYVSGAHLEFKAPAQLHTI